MPRDTAFPPAMESFNPQNLPHPTTQTFLFSPRIKQRGNTPPSLSHTHTHTRALAQTSKLCAPKCRQTYSAHGVPLGSKPRLSGTLFQLPFATLTFSEKQLFKKQTNKNSQIPSTQKCFLRAKISSNVFLLCKLFIFQALSRRTGASEMSIIVYYYKRIRTVIVHKLQSFVCVRVSCNICRACV